MPSPLFTPFALGSLNRVVAEAKRAGTQQGAFESWPGSLVASVTVLTCAPIAMSEAARASVMPELEPEAPLLEVSGLRKYFPVRGGLFGGVVNLAHGAALDRRVGQLLERVGLPGSYRSRYPHESSGGQLLWRRPNPAGSC